MKINISYNVKRQQYHLRIREEFLGVNMFFSNEEEAQEYLDNYFQLDNIKSVA